MSTSALARVPAHFGYFLLSRTGRLIAWAFSRFMAAPLQNASIAFLAAALAFSASNALFWQSGAHPAPMFVTGSTTPAEPHNKITSLPPQPLPAPARAVPPPPSELTAPTSTPASPPVQVDQSIVDHEVTNAALKAAQTVLQSLGLYDGKIDGFYGPATAEGLRAFELRNGYTPRGALTPQIIARILASTNARQPSAPSISAQETVGIPAQDTESESSNSEIRATERAATTEMPIGPDPLSVLTQSVANQSSPPPQSLPAQRELNADAELIKKIQRGLASLAFLHGPIDGVAGEATARAIRNFEVYNNYEVTGQVSPEMLDLLIEAGATI